jgi:hypothetical protein
VAGSLSLVWLLSTGSAYAGLFGSDAPSRIPVPARVFSADVVDNGGTSLHVSRVSFDGEVFVYGTFGLAQVTIPFDRIASVEFRAGADQDHRVAVVTPTSGEPVQLVVEYDKPIYGLTTFGNYKIEVRDVKRLVITGQDAP